MNEAIQSDFSLDQERGQIGALSRPTTPYTADAIKVGANGAGLRPGDAFKIVSGLAVKVSDLADSANADGIVSFEYGTVNGTVSGGTNNTQGIEYAEGDIIKYIKTGTVYVIAGGVIAEGTEIGFDPADHTWKAQINSKRSMRTTKPFTADGAVGEVTLGDYLGTGAAAANAAAIDALDTRVTALEGA